MTDSHKRRPMGKLSHVPPHTQKWPHQPNQQLLRQHQASAHPGSQGEGAEADGPCEWLCSCFSTSRNRNPVACFVSCLLWRSQPQARMASWAFRTHLHHSLSPASPTMGAVPAPVPWDCGFLNFQVADLFCTRGHAHSPVGSAVKLWCLSQGGVKFRS